MLTRLSRITILLLLTVPVQAKHTQNITLAQQQQVNSSCLSIARKLSSVTFTECLNRDLAPSSHQSAKSKNLLIKEYPPLLDKRRPQAKILMLGGIHGDEYSSVTIMFKWMKILDKYHSGLFHWKVIPLVNPDGLLQKKSQRVNANGVDLNRNFPNNGSPHASLEYWKNKAYSDARRYPGPSPSSEPETKWLVELIKKFKPDAIVAVHAPFGIVDYDGPPKAPSHLGPLYLKLLGTYPGSLGNYAGLQQKIPVVTVELPYAGIMPSDQEVVHIWTDMVRWLRKNIHQQPVPAENNTLQYAEPDQAR